MRRILLSVVLTVMGGLALPGAYAQQAGIQRTDLLQQVLSVSDREVVQVRVDFAPGAIAAKHAHPGEEIAYVLEGSLEYQLEGREPVTLTAGQTLFIPAGVPHAAKNVGGGSASELATYIVTKGAPLLAPVD